jgi:ribosomal protein L11 methyltransferase
MRARRYPLVLANILATPLKLLAPLLCGMSRRRAPGARRHPRAPGRRAEAGLFAVARAPVSDEEDGWILMTARRSA